MHNKGLRFQHWHPSREQRDILANICKAYYISSVVTLNCEMSFSLIARGKNSLFIETDSKICSESENAQLI